MKLSNPHMLYLVWLVVLLVGVMVYGNLKRARILARFAAPKALETIAPGINPGIRWARIVLITLVLFCLVGALSGPLAGFRWQTVEQKGVDIMICLDCSRSMLAQDIKPTRLERAKREIIDLMGMIQSDRAGLVAFAGRAILQCPLTLDHSAFNLFLNALEPDYLPVGGTDLGGAIETALNGFEKEVESEKAIILITDGENTTGDSIEMAKKAADQGVKIFCIGVGSPEGAPVPDSAGGFKKDRSGKIIISRVDEPALKKIAAMTQGVYVRSVAGDMDLDRIYDQEILGRMEKKTLKSGRQKVWENRFQWLLIPGILLLMIEMMLENNRRGIFFSAVLVPAFFILNSGVCHADASASVKNGIKAYDAGDYDQAEKHFIDAQLDRPDMAELYYNIGGAAYKKGDFDAAVKNFTRARQTDDPGLKPKAIYNLGNALYRSGNLKAAIKAYEELVSLSPEDKEARENLEFVKKKLEEQQNKDQQNKDQQNRDQQNKDQQKKDQQSQDQKNKDQRNKEQQSQDQQNQDPQDQGQQDPGQKKEPPKDQDRKPDGSPSQEKGQVKEDQSPGQQDIQSRERMLNRLKDKPGRAMMPAYGGGTVTKDW
ncbi:conserved hypothetical protein [Desulforapulum autotrophicum HRM2]|uniref:VWFA domain-containing protein n=1 Tax=Desulforapulum autotrophicum (strain ATCC 43914 / DSM 3382 / VKM B-1955 / HRM2) TaxID=177437 RepID=C0QK10_DESAH|nr:VWA domain-containing protein [Desulforapulum autotrophicum]ACN16036.1 conserved hypothetical protein [Desulforapulum autotrophicum HRM2]